MPTEQLHQLALRHTSDACLQLQLKGDWTRTAGTPAISPVQQALQEQAVDCLTLDLSELGEWDSMLIVFLRKLKALADEQSVTFRQDMLPQDLQGLLKLSNAVPERQGARRHESAPDLLTRVGNLTIRFFQDVWSSLDFVGEVVLAFVRFLLGKASYSKRDLFLFIQEAGFEALPIVSLISLLIGMILAFVGAYQLANFGAEIYVADLVAIGMTREMGPVMAGIIMAGRTGAAFAAQLGSMQVNEEIDALKTMGIDPMEYLVLPRMLALILMMPLLVVYADVVGVLGGLLVSVLMFDLTVAQYVNQTLDSVALAGILIGIGKGALFGLLIASAGCFQGIRSGRSAAAVGQATTSAVVMSIVSIVVADSVVTIMTTILGV
jgi:phospholipid/cholesterol/gamma-HCH transport system permease protein